MECQNRTICRGEYSIFARLRREGIDPDEYITFFGLRGWGKLSSGTLTTEAVRSLTSVEAKQVTDFPRSQVYIHAKAMIVDDRTVIIGCSSQSSLKFLRGGRLTLSQQLPTSTSDLSEATATPNSPASSATPT